MTGRKRITAADYRQRMRDIRKFVDFDYDLRKPLSSAAKARINSYHDAIEKLTIRPHQVFRARTEKNLRAVQRFAQHDKRHKLIKVAFVPTDGESKAKVSISRRGEVRSKVGHIRVFEIPLDTDRLIEEGADYVAEAIAEGPEVQRYVIQAGAFEVPSTSLPEFVVRDVSRIMAKYGADKYDPNKNSSHYFGNWLFGLNGYRFRKQDELTAYRANKKAATQRASREKIKRRKAKAPRNKTPRDMGS